LFILSDKRRGIIDEHSLLISHDKFGERLCFGYVVGQTMAFERQLLEQVKSLDSKLTAIIPMWYVHVTNNEREYAGVCTLYILEQQSYFGVCNSRRR